MFLRLVPALSVAAVVPLAAVRHAGNVACEIHAFDGIDACMRRRTAFRTFAGTRADAADCRVQKHDKMLHVLTTYTTNYSEQL